MAENFFSDHFNANTVPGVTTLTGSLTLDNQRRSSAGIGNARMRYKRATMTLGTGAVIGSELRLMQFLSSDRLFSLLVTSDGGATAFDADLGLYLTGTRHDGAVLDVDLYSDTAIDTDTAQARVEYMTDGALAAKDVGKPLWEQLAVGAGTDTTDPFKDYDLVLTVTMALTVALTTLQVEAYYTSGD